MCEATMDNSIEKQIKIVKKYLKFKIMEDNLTFRYYKKNRDHIFDLIKRTIVNGESHSAILLGPRGCGKTTLMNSVLHQVSKEVDIESDAIIIRLNGLIHHDDKIALKSITAQMQLENAVGDRIFGTFAENLAFLLSCLQSGVDRRCKSMVFVLEEFDIFCHTGRIQTLLYNLFDITDSRQAPMCVIGITNRLDVTDLLEKRVKSRFSCRNIHMFPNEAAELKDSVDNCKQVLVEVLSLPEVKRAPKKGRSRKNTGAEEIESVPDHSIPEDVLIRCKVDPQFYQLEPSFVEDWNDHIKSLAENTTVSDALDKMLYYTVNQQIYRNILFQLVSRLSVSHPYITAADFSSTIDKTVAGEHRVQLLQSLSILEWSLVIAMMHSIALYDGQPMNFEMVLKKYADYMNSYSKTQMVPRPVILKAFEHLQALEIIMPVKNVDSIYNSGDVTASGVQKEYKLFALAVPIDDLRAAVKCFKALPTEITHWFNNCIV